MPLVDEEEAYGDTSHREGLMDTLAMVALAIIAIAGSVMAGIEDGWASGETAQKLRR
jgi:hypothetical protein